MISVPGSPNGIMNAGRIGEEDVARDHLGIESGADTSRRRMNPAQSLGFGEQQLRNAETVIDLGLTNRRHGWR